MRKAKDAQKRDGKRAGKIASAVTVAGAVGQAGLAVAAGTAGNPELAAASAALALFPPLIAACIPAVFNRRLNRVNEWWAWVCDLDAADHSIAAAIDRRVQEEPEAQDVVVAALREVLEAPGEEAVRPLAMLTREYIRAGAKRDRFFRGVAGMLGEITGAELDELKRLLVEMVREEGDHVQVENIRSQPRRVGIATLTEQDEGRPQRIISSDLFPQIEDIFQLMKAHGLGSERSTVSWGMVPSADKLVVERAIAVRILRYLS